MNMKTFKHSGDMGDIIYSLPSMKALGGGVLFLDPLGGPSNKYIKKQCPDGRTNLNKKSIDFMAPLLKSQSYISDVRYFNNENIDYDLDNFRDYLTRTERRSDNLVDCSLQSLGFNFDKCNDSWIDVSPINIGKKIVIAYSPRRQGNYAWMKFNLKNIVKDSIFIGLEKEHEFFEWIYSIKIDYYKESSIMDLCSLIKGSELVISNSTFMLSLAIGMNHPNIIQQVDYRNNSTVFPNRKITYI